MMGSSGVTHINTNHSSSGFSARTLDWDRVWDMGLGCELLQHKKAKRSAQDRQHWKWHQDAPVKQSIKLAYVSWLEIF